MKIIVDKDIPFIQGVLEPYAQVRYLKGREIGPQDAADADALVIRTRTRCNAALLEGSAVKFIATATIGTDHIDLEWCRSHGITVSNAAGCNAGGVMQYVFTALYALARRKGFLLPDGKWNRLVDDTSGRKYVLGVIGVGNVGSKVAALGEYLGFEVLRCDPAKERQQTLDFNNGNIRLKDFKDYYSLDYLLERSDIVTLHVCMEEGNRNMVGEEFIGKMKKGAVLMNSSRGEVVDEQALLRNRDRLGALVLDVWGNEPRICRELLEKTDLATPHIAGYSYEGKVNGTVMSVRALAEFFSLEPLKGFTHPAPVKNHNFLCAEGKSQAEIAADLTDIFPIFEDDARLRENPSAFETLRSEYNYRREFYVMPKTKEAN